jgi:hypothetical protein
MGGGPGWYRPPFEAYNVRYIPLYLLLDRNGKVVGANLRGAGLDRAIERELAEEAVSGDPPSTYQ